MEPGSIVKLIISSMSEKSSKGSVDVGALAEVVDGPKEFPELHKELVERVGDISKEFIWVRWIQADPRWHQRIDGAYFKHRFENLSNRVLN